MYPLGEIPDYEPAPDTSLGRLAAASGRPVGEWLLDALLAEAGVDKTRLISANIWLTDAKHFAELNAAWEAWVPAGHAPTRACVQSGLMRPGIDVEIAVTALAKG